MIGLLNELRPAFDTFSKSRRENIVKNVFDKLSSIPNTDDKQIALCREYIEYFRKDQRHSLRQRFETKLSALLTKQGKYPEALSLLASLLTEIKKLDDKLLLVEIHLIESQVHFALDNLSKSRSALTAARTNANAVYIGVELQSEIDMQSGALNAHERDFRTSFSYFFEAFEGFMSKAGSENQNARQALIYMLLSKIMNNQAREVASILNQKNSLPFVSDPTILIMKAIADTVKNRSLEKFSKILDKPDTKDAIESDKLLKKSFKELEDELLEKNLARIIEPYSRVEVDRIAQIMKMDEEKVMTKLTQMILDKKLRGIIDQGSGELIIYDEPMTESTYQDSLELLGSMGNVVNNLIRRAKHLQAQ